MRYLSAPKEKKAPKQNQAKDSANRKSTAKREKKGNSATKSEKTLDKTLNLFSQSRVTVEVLDDASPDTTPRLDYDITSEKERAAATLREAQRVQNVRTAEKDFRSMHFIDEKIRVLNKHDTFVPAPGVSVEDVEREKSRLQRLEESAREKQLAMKDEVHERVNFLGKDRSAVRLQALFRGHIGRQKYALNKRLQELSDGNAGDWIEVRDRESGDVWFYNKITGVSQWDRPDEMFSTLAAKSELKTLPSIKFEASSPSKATLRQPKNKSVLLSKSMTLPTLQATIISKKGFKDDADPIDIEARKEVQQMLGLDKLTPAESLMAPDGHFKPQLRATVMDALLETRFDSVSSVLADERWINSEVDQFTKKRAAFGLESRPHPLRKPMVSVVKLDEDKPKLGHQIVVKNANTTPFATSRDATVDRLH